MKKKALAALVCFCLFLGILSGCASDGVQLTDPTTTTQTTTQTSTMDPADGLQMELFYKPWVGIPIEGEDSYIKWIEEVTGADWTFNYASDFESEIVTRAVSGTMPDLMVVDTYVMLFKLWGEGVLLDDWNSYADQLPMTFENIGEAQMSYFTVDGKLSCVPTLGGEQLYSYMIRKDWLDNLGLEMPTTLDGFLDVARAFTFDDPDGNGKDDTYGISSAGGGTMGEVLQLQNLWAPYNYLDLKSGFYITEDNQVSSNIVDGNLKKCLDLIRVIVNEGLIDPDWYSMGLDERKPGTYSGKYGVLLRWAPEDLLNETNQARNLDGQVKDWWEVFPLFSAEGNEEGGKLPAMSPFGMIRTVSEQTGQSKAKMEAVCKLLEATAFPNEGYFVLRAGVGVNGRSVKPIGDRYYINHTENTLGDKQNTNIGLANYGKFINSYTPKANIIWGSAAYPDDVMNRALEMSAQVETLARYENSYHFMLRLDTAAIVECNSMMEEFAINYILQKTDDYEGFVQEWLKNGGQLLLDEAKQQLTERGYIK